MVLLRRVHPYFRWTGYTLCAVLVLSLVYYVREPYTSSIHTRTLLSSSRESTSSSSSSIPPSHVTYSPHSGFHNQRIALENGLTLAMVLGRRLLVPPLILPSIPWSPNMTTFPDVPSLTSTLPASTPTTVMSWTDYYPFSDFPVLTHVPPSFRPSYFQLPPETHRYMYQYTDQPDLSPTSPYVTTVDVNVLKVHPYVHLGSLFGSQRVRLLQPKHRDIQVWVQTQFTKILMTNTTQTSIQSMVHQLGGPQNYVALHVRGREVFADRLDQVLKDMMHALTPYQAQICHTLSMYMATDLQELPTSFLHRYPCLHVAQPKDMWVDIHVASQARLFLGTLKSTFSQFIQHQFWVQQCGALVGHSACHRRAKLM